MIALDSLRQKFPPQGFFAEKEWLLSPEPFPLDATTAEEIRSLGYRLLLFYRACNRLYERSVKGTLPSWIAAYCDAGKPAGLLQQARAPALRQALPRIIRPDLLLTERGLVAAELDSVPGGIGLTAWLNQTYGRNGGGDVLGGATGMLEGFTSILPGGADILISEEAAGYRPEMEWLTARLNEQTPTNGGRSYRVVDAEDYVPLTDRDAYRFFELFDLANLPSASALLDAAAAGRQLLTPPPKPWLEEKLWMALFWARPLRDVWRRELSDNQFRRLSALFPQSWVVDPTPLPHHAVIPGLDVHNWMEIAQFTQKKRELVLKLSGFHDHAWGARSVTVGHDVSHRDWEAALEHAIASFPAHPYVLQEFHRSKIVEHPYFDRETGAIQTMRGRVRLCPYYFVSQQDDRVTLGGVLATICPEDKKILHGMKDAIMAPCRESGESFHPSTLESRKSETSATRSGDAPQPPSHP
ncbi:MAG: hypothetical protein ACR2OZ_07420 [Verrucomicrobiales bacterium]